ncbi:hypothetical protein [Micromonospora sp. NPDC051006]|uniref:hypothetical protein n=1 Tax=Micromonospora sp. NPDC051006 TaxID=3364283 RepID=UPI0037BB3041
MTAALAPATVLDAAQWQARQRAHEERVDAWLTPHLARRRRGETHPVEDFLFTYYSHRPAQLRRWHPGAGVELRGADPTAFGADYRATDDGILLTPTRETQHAHEQPGCLHANMDLRKRNSGTSRRWGVCKRHEADKGPNR